MTAQLSRERIEEIANFESDLANKSFIYEDARRMARMLLAGMDSEPVGEVIEQPSGLVMDGMVNLPPSTYRNIKGLSAMKRLPLGTKFYAAPPVPVADSEYGDAYQGAREDLSIWKLRTLEAEGEVRRLGEINDYLVKQAQGESRMGEPLIRETAPMASTAPDGLRMALSNAGIAAPESDEVLFATREKYVQLLVDWVKDRKPFESAPGAVPDERAAFNSWNNDIDCPLAGLDAKTAAWKAWNYRAAMQAEPVTAAWIAEAKKLAELHGISFVIFRNGEQPVCADPTKFWFGFDPAAPEQEV